MRVIDCPDCDYCSRQSPTYWCNTCHNIGKVKIAPLTAGITNAQQCNCGNISKQTSAGCPIHGVVY